eukprot:7998-Chlamydomonas_euryale.AAC.1
MELEVVWGLPTHPLVFEVHREHGVGGWTCRRESLCMECGVWSAVGCGRTEAHGRKCWVGVVGPDLRPQRKRICDHNGCVHTLRATLGSIHISAGHAYIRRSDL